MVAITGGTYTQTDGTNSFSHTISNFLLGKYEVTYDLWYKVYQWAISHGYYFANPGREGSNGTDGAELTTAKYEPVTNINCNDAMVWCNAYSEMTGLTPVYTYSSQVIRDPRDTNATACTSAVCNWSANGYRLPSEGEWQYAASNKGATPYNYASGATADINNATETGKVAWYTENSGSMTKPVGTKQANQLGIYDMSGNVYERCWDWYGDYPTNAQTNYRGPAGPVSEHYRVIRGGCYDRVAAELPVGYRRYESAFFELPIYGFRVARTN